MACPSFSHGLYTLFSTGCSCSLPNASLCVWPPSADKIISAGIVKHGPIDSEQILRRPSSLGANRREEAIDRFVRQAAFTLVKISRLSDFEMINHSSSLIVSVCPGSGGTVENSVGRLTGL